MKIFIDMDGVLADFVTPSLRIHNAEDLYTKESSKGVFDIDKLLGISAKQFWGKLKESDFWFNLSKTPEADEIIAMAVKKVGEKNIALLSSPSLSPHCVPGKNAWVKRWYPQFSKQIIYGSAKHFFAGPDRILIDDMDKNIYDFTQADGYGVLVPRPWNSEHHWSDQVVEQVKRKLNVWVEGFTKK